MNNRPALVSGSLRLAHRGDQRVAPENTVAALVAATRVAGCDGVEFDVRAARDGTPIVLHDETLARVFASPERAADRSPAELAALGVPTLAEVLAALPASAWLDVELKEDVVAACLPLLAAARGDPPMGVVVSSFEAPVLAHLAALAPTWPRWLNADDLAPDTVRRAVDLGCRGVSVEWRALDGRSIGRAVAAGLEVAAWTVRRRPTARRLARLGVVALCVEGPALDG